MEGFERYMNPPECPVVVGGTYYNNVEMCENPFVVKSIEADGVKFYAICSHVDEFTGVEEEVRVYAGYLSTEKE